MSSSRTHLLLWHMMLSLIFCSFPARAHDIPDERVDRGLQIELTPPRLRVVYEVSLTEWTLYQDLKRLAPGLAPGERLDRIDGYAQFVAPLNARGLLASVDETEVIWKVDEVQVEFEEHLLLRFHFSSEIARQGHLRLRDTNYASSYGTSRLALRSDSGTRMSGYEGPANLADVPEVPIWLLSDLEERSTREVEVDYHSESRSSTGLSENHVASAAVAPDTPLRSSSEGQPQQPQLLTRLLWDASGRTLPFLLVTAFVLGAAHMLQPGHGKSAVVGASLQDARPISRGLILAASAAGAHLLLAVGLASLAVLLVPSGFDRLDDTLTRVVGLILAILGAWRVGHALSQVAGEEGTVTSVRSSQDAVLTGLAIGSIPCWDAVLLLAISWVAGKLSLGIALLIAFSLGAAATLLGIALVLGLFRRFARSLSRSNWVERSVAMLGGLLLTVIGGYLFLSS